MLNWLKSFTGWKPKTGWKRKPCDHPGVSISLGIHDNTPGYTRCHFCDKVRIRYNTGKYITGTLHTYTKTFWVVPDFKLEQALKTKPREFGDLRIEKWLRNNDFNLE